MKYLLTILIFLMGLLLVSCDDGVPKGTLKVEDIYGTWRHEFDDAVADVIFRKDVCRLQVRWKDGEVYDGAWSEWEYYWDEPNLTYSLCISPFPTALVQTGKKSNKHCESLGLACPFLMTRGEVVFDANMDLIIEYRKVASSDGAIRKEDNPVHNINPDNEKE